MNLDRPLLSRRDALKYGGLTVTLGSLVAACGENRTGDTAPGRVGNAPVVTDLPTYEVDDAVLLRTASSLEYTAVEAYTRALALDGAVPADAVPLIERLIADHESVAARMVELTEAVGGEAWTCSNTWLIDRLIEPVFEAIVSPVVGIILGPDSPASMRIAGEELDATGDIVTTSNGVLEVVSEVGLDGGRVVTIDGQPAEEGDEVRFVRPIDDIAADVASFATALESLAAAAHQELAVAVGDSEVTVAHAEAAALEARHAAVLAITIGGSDAYTSPVLVGEEPVADARGQFVQYAIPSRFATTAQIEIKAGPRDSNAVRTSYVLQTPAANSLVYNELTCDAP